MTLIKGIVNPIPLLCSFALIFLFSQPIYTQSFTQIGLDIDGVAGDGSGSSVALSEDGSVVAIGSPFNDSAGNAAGTVRVYAWNGTTWVQRGADINGEAANDFSGIAVSISSDGSIVAIGADSNDGNGIDSGHVRIYQWSGSNWTQLGSDIDGEAAYDNSGRKLSLSADGRIIAIGATNNDAGGNRSGHVRIYAYNGTSWIKKGDDIDGKAAGDRLGSSVSIAADGLTIAIGADGNGGNGSSNYAAIYEWNGVNDWIQKGTDIPGEAVDDYFGAAISISSDGSMVAIGAAFNDGNGTNSGHVRVYQWNGSNWGQLGSDIDGEAIGSGFGQSVSLSSDGLSLAVGANYVVQPIEFTGRTYIYNWINGAWTIRSNPIDSEAFGDYSGAAISLNSAGSIVAIGATENDGNGTNSGHVRIFSLVSPPTINNLDNQTVAWPGVGNTVLLDAESDALLADSDFDALNALNGDWAGASLTVQRSGSVISSDVFGFNTSGSLFTLSTSNLQSGGQTFATYTNTAGVISINFTSSETSATSALVNAVARSITYRNDTPAGDATIRIRLSDGTSIIDATANISVTSDFIYVTNATDNTTIDITDGVSFNEATAIAAADTTGSQTIVFDNSLASTSLTINNVSLTESLTFDMAVAGGMILGGGTITTGIGTTQIFTNGSSANATLSNIIAGDGTITKEGLGTLTLSGANTFTGATAINRGSLLITHANALGTIDGGTIVADGAALELSNISDPTDPSTYISETINLIGGGPDGMGALKNVSLTINVIDGNINLDGGALISCESSGELQLQGNLTATNHDVTFSGAADIVVYGGISIGSGSFYKEGSGLVSLASPQGAITFSGGTVVNNGTLTLAFGYALPDNGSLTINSPGVVRVEGGSEAIGALSGDGIIELRTNQAFVVGDSTNTVFSGNIIETSSNGALTKKGSGKLILTSPDNSFTGNLSILGGSLEIGGSGRLGMGSYAGDISITSGNSFSYASDSSHILSGDISGDGSITKSEISTLKLTGNNTYAGATSINAGTLIIEHNAPVTSTSSFTGSGTLIIQPRDNSFSTLFSTNNWTFGPILGGLTIGKSTNTSDISLPNAVTTTGPITIYGNSIAIDAPVTSSASTINLNASGTVTQTAPLSALGLDLYGVGEFILNHISNTITTLSAGNSSLELGGLNVVDASGGLTIGTVGQTGIYSSGDIVIQTLSGNILVNEPIISTNSSGDTVQLFADKDASVNEAGDGNIQFSGRGTTLIESGARALLFSGLESLSTDLTNTVGGFDNIRFEVDATTDLSTITDPIASTGKYALYREVPQVPTPTTLFLSGPSNTQVGISSTDFTLMVLDQNNNPINVTTTTNFSLTTIDELGSASFTPSSLSIPAGSSSTTFTYTNSNIGDGTHTLIVTKLNGENLPGGSVSSIDIAIDGINVNSLAIETIEEITYSGTAIEPLVVVKNGEMVLTSGIDYTATYSNNELVGTANIIISGMGNFIGSKTIPFTILPAHLEITANSATKVYDSTPLTDSRSFISSGSLIAGHSYSVTVTGSQTNVGSSSNIANSAYLFVDSTDVTSNYTISYVNGILEVTPATIEINPDEGQYKSYGELDPILKYTVLGALTDITMITGSLGRESGEDVGYYNYTIGTLSVNANYSLLLSEGEKFEIQRIDSDGDGVPDDVEDHEGTDKNNPIDFLDSDADGVSDFWENQNGTDPNDPGDHNDFDGDGIVDNEDNDDDNDGVEDSLDQCPNTPLGVSVNTSGCEVFSLPANNFSVNVSSAACPDTSNGSITISSSNTDYSYRYSINNQPQVVLSENTQTISNLGAGIYSVCITVDGIPNYERCYTVVVSEPSPLQASSIVNTGSRQLQLNLSGAKEYQVSLNGKTRLTSERSLMLNLRPGMNRVKVVTNLSCQGVYSEEIFVSEEVRAYPNPTTGPIQLFVAGRDRQVKLIVSSLTGTVVRSALVSVPENRLIATQLSDLPAAVYLIKLEGETVNKTLKVIKN